MNLVQLRCVSVQVFCAAFMVTVLAEVRGLVCQSDHFLQIQKICRAQNEALLTAEKNHDDGMVCKSLFDFWHCVAGNVPVCFHNLTEIYKMYFHSPHNCALSPDQIMQLQDLTKRTAEQQGDSGVDVEVDVVSLSSSTASSPAVDVSESSSSSSSSSEKEGDGGGGRGSKQATVGENEKGDTHKHTGSGSSLSCRCGSLMVVMSWLVGLRMTSYLIHS